MTPLLLVGGGGHCRSCIEVIETNSEYDIAGIVLPDIKNSQPILGYPVIGVDDELEQLLSETPRALISVGQIKSPDVRIRLFEKLIQLRAEMPVVIASTAYCSRHAYIGYGTILMHGVIVNAAANIGENCIINSQSLVEHDSQIEPHCHIATGARINGGVHVGMGTFIGSGAIIRENVRIGSRVVIGAGQVILKDVPEGAIVI
ncbi:MAG: acetyltransferase [Chloroflexota bacterium]|nr:acetyltransferase [Chloroflexota bacterium]